MNYREPAPPQEWTITTGTSADERAEQHQHLIETYGPFFWGETVGLGLVGALLASAVGTPSDPNATPQVLAVTVIVAALYRFSVVPILTRATLRRAPAFSPKIKLGVSDAGFSIDGTYGREFHAWDWVDRIEETGTGEKKRISIATRTAHEISGPAANFPAEAVAAIRARILPAGAREGKAGGTGHAPSTFVDRGLTPIEGGLVRFRESGDTVLNPTTRPTPLAASEIVAVRIPFAIPPFAVALAYERARHWPRSAHVLGALAVSTAAAYFLFKWVATKTTFALRRFQVLLDRKALRALKLQLCEEGFACEWEGGWTLTEWQNVEAVDETEKCIGYRTGLTYRAIPKKAFAAGEQETFQAIAARKIAAARKPSV